MHATLGRSGLVACDLILGLHQATRAQAHYKLERPDSLPRNQPAPTRRRTRTRRSGQTRRAHPHIWRLLGTQVEMRWPLPVAAEFGGQRSGSHTTTGHQGESASACVPGQQRDSPGPVCHKSA